MEEMDLETAQTTTTANLPILKQENGNSFKPAAQTTTNADGTSTSLIPGPVTTEEKVQKKNDVKARSMLLMALPNEHLMTFNNYKDAKTLFAAIQIRFGDNDATKKTQKNLLKQMYENFSAPSTESLDSIFNRLQQIVSQLAILGENISQEDLNLKCLRSLPSEWNTHVVVWKNKPDLDTISFDDLYNNFKIVEQEVKRTASSSSSSISTANTQVSTASTQVSTANLSDATVYAFLANQPNGSQLVHEDLEQIHEDDLEEMDLKWQLALLSMRTRRFFQKTGRKITINGSDTAGYDKSKVECFNCHKMGHFARECRGPRNQDSRNRNQDSSRRTVNVEETSSKAMVAINGAATYKRGLASVEEKFVFYKKNAVIFCEQLADLKRDISYKDSEISMLKSELKKLKQEKESNQLKIKNFDNASKSLDKLIGSQITDKSRKGVGFRSSNSLSLKDMDLRTSKTLAEDFSNELGNSLMLPLIEKVQRPRGNQGNLNNQKSQQLGSNFVMYNKACFVCGRFDHVQADCNYHHMERMVSGNNYTRVDYNYYAKKAHPNAHRNMVPKAVLMKTGLRPLNTARPVNTAHPKTTVYSARPMSRFLNQHNQLPKAVNTARPNSAVVDAVKANQGHTHEEDQGYVDSGCSRYMTGNISYLSDFKKFDGGYVTFGGGAKGGKITSKGTLKTGKLDFEDVYFVKELQFNLFSVSQMYDKKNSVLFTDTRCFVLSPDFNLADESQATLDESMLWHRRLGHGKQYKASCKSKIQNSITQPLFMLHMDLFSKTFVSSLMNKKYCLVITDDYSKFTWVFFLASKDETSGIIKIFIIEIENLVDKKVKIIRCDNGTEFKNRVMSDFCEKKGIKREFSVARTPQQNGVDEKRNITLIEDARTMLAYSKLPTTFWTKAVNTACYVQNRVLVVKPHNKTPYELFKGRTPALSFMRPFVCHVTILNTLDYLGKFDGKLDEGFFVGYLLNSKAFRVYNIRTRKVEENLHVRFLEDKPIIAGDGPKWLFDIDVLTKSMNYVPIVAGTNFNDSVGIEESVGTGHSSQETGSSQDHILMPLWKDGSLFGSSSKNASNDEPQPSSDVGKKDDEGVSQESRINDQERPKNNTQDVNPAWPSINTANTNVNTGSLNINTISPTITTTLLEATHADFFSDETELYMSNITTTYLVPSTLNTRIPKDHLLDHVIGDVQSGVQTRRITKTSNEQGFISVVYEGKTHEDLHTFDLPYGKRAIGTKCVYKNKKDERDDIIFGSTRNEMSTEFEKMTHKKFQMSSMGELTFFLGLQVTQKHDRIFISRDKYVDEILKKFGFSTVKTASTPMETSKLLLKDVEDEDVDVYLYKSMIGSLMYLTASTTDIMFVICVCARFQVTPKVSHLYDVKRIFRYLKGQPKLGLWYPKDSPFDLEAYTNSDYAGASLDRKSTTGGCQFLGSRLISWQYKKQIVVANSTTEAKYVAAASWCGQVLWIQNQMLDYGYNFMNTKIFIDNESTIYIVKNLVFHSKTKHIEIRHHFIRDSNEKKLIQMIKIDTN
ncbi:putative ribonuclease H-like domain-containing protein [Tanacetum coccineum]